MKNLDFTQTSGFQIFLRKNWNICNLASSSPWQQQHWAASTHSGWWPKFPAHSHPAAPSIPASVRVCHAHSTFSSLFLPPHLFLPGSHWGRFLTHFSLHPIPNFPFTIIFPPSEKTFGVYTIPPGTGGGAERKDLPRMIGQLLGWLPPGNSDSSSAPWNAPNQLSFRLMVTQNRAHCPLLQVENRSASNSLCDLEEITLPFWASVAPSTQWNYVEWRKVG